MRFKKATRKASSPLKMVSVHLDKASLLVLDSHLNLNSRLDGDGSDLLHDISWGVEIDDTLVDAHLEAIPGLGALTARSHTGGDAESLGWEADRASDLALEAVALSLALEVRADCTREMEGVSDGRGEKREGQVKVLEEEMVCVVCGRIGMQKRCAPCALGARYFLHTSPRTHVFISSCHMIQRCVVANSCVGAQGSPAKHPCVLKSPKNTTKMVLTTTKRVFTHPSRAQTHPDW
jgi:hypothetical protein